MYAADEIFITRDPFTIADLIGERRKIGCPGEIGRGILIVVVGVHTGVEDNGIERGAEITGREWIGVPAVLGQTENVVWIFSGPAGLCVVRIDGIEGGRWRP